MALTTLQILKENLQVPASNTSRDVFLDRLRKGAEAIIKAKLKRDLEVTSYTEYFDGNGRQTLVLRQRPVTLITNVWEDSGGYFGQGLDSPFSSLTLLASGTDYALELDKGGTISSSGILLRLRTTWLQRYNPYRPGHLYMENADSLGNIKVTYTAGYSTIPDDIQYAVALVAAAMRRDTKVGGPVQTERIGDYSYEIMNGRERFSFGAYPVPNEVESILSAYKDPCF